MWASFKYTSKSNELPRQVTQPSRFWLQKSESFWKPDASVIWFLSGIWLTWNNFKKWVWTEQVLLSLQLSLDSGRWSWLGIFIFFSVLIQFSTAGSGWGSKSGSRGTHGGECKKGDVLVQLRVKPAPGLTLTWKHYANQQTYWITERRGIREARGVLFKG